MKLERNLKETEMKRRDSTTKGPRKICQTIRKRIFKDKFRDFIGQISHKPYLSEFAAFRQSPRLQPFDVIESQIQSAQSCHVRGQGGWREHSEALSAEVNVVDAAGTCFHGTC